MAFEMGLSVKEFWRTTPLNFVRMQAAYRKRQDLMLWPLRRLEAALWNVQIAKTENGEPLEVTDFYPLSTDALVKKEPRKRGSKKDTSGRMSREDYLKMIERSNKAAPPTEPPNT